MSDPDPGLDASQRSPVHVPTVLQMHVDDVEKMLIGIRERRLTSVRKLEELEKVAKAKAMTASTLAFEKAIEKAKKQLSKVDDALDKLESFVYKARALQLELDD